MGRRIMEMKQADPKGLVREAYAIEGIGTAECRSIFLDWALSLAAGTDPREAMRVLIAHYLPGREDHPMTVTLVAGLGSAPEPKRRGGRAARLAGGV